MKTENPIKLALSASLKDARFVRGGDTWRREEQEVVLLVHLQKSNFGEQYYLCLGAYVKSLGEPGSGLNLDALKEPQCHVRIRAESIEGAQQNWKAALDLENATLTAAERNRILNSLVNDAAIPWLRACGTVEEIKQALREGRLKGAFVHRLVRAMVD